MTGLAIPPHALAIAVVHPRIAPNTGALARLCVATGTALHLVRPFGFVLDEAKARRAGLDYWPRLKLTLHDDTDAFVEATKPRRVWALENDAGPALWETAFADGDMLVLGSETNGLPFPLRERWRDRTISIPQAAGERCLNVTSAASVALYEALRQIGSK